MPALHSAHHPHHFDEVRIAVDEHLVTIPPGRHTAVTEQMLKWMGTSRDPKAGFQEHITRVAAALTQKDNRPRLRKLVDEIRSRVSELLN